MNSLMELKELHDALLESQPSGVDHDTASCPLCAPVEGGDMSKTYSQEEFDAAVAEALNPLRKELEDMKASQEQTEIEARIANEKAELETRISEIQAELDSAVLKAAEAEKQHGELVAYLEALVAEEAQAAELARRTEERLTVVREVASFPEEYIEANTSRWVALDDESFEALVNDWRAVAKKEEKPAEQTVIPSQTAMVASRTESGNGSALREVLDLTLRGVDLKSL